jgi:hypothetical protein
MRHWRRELRNTSARTCATAFPRRVLYSRGTPGMMSRSRPRHGRGSSFRRDRGRQALGPPIADAVTRPWQAPPREFRSSANKFADLHPIGQSNFIAAPQAGLTEPAKRGFRVPCPSVDAALNSKRVAFLAYRSVPVPAWRRHLGFPEHHSGPHARGGEGRRPGRPILRGARRAPHSSRTRRSAACSARREAAN